MNDFSPQYDLFLSYNSQDCEIVADIRQQLLQLSQSLNTFIGQQTPLIFDPFDFIWC